MLYTCAPIAGALDGGSLRLLPRLVLATGQAAAVGNSYCTDPNGGSAAAASRCDEMQAYDRPMRATQFKDWMNEHGAEQDCERGSRRTDNTLVVLDYDRFGNASNRLTPVARQ